MRPPYRQREEKEGKKVHGFRLIYFSNAARGSAL
jgi:hypothetical protein